MKKIIKLLLLLVVSLTVNSKDICKTTCPVKLLEATLKADNNAELLDENEWILTTRFKY